MTDEEKYCYTHSSCSGDKAARHGGGVMTFDECCSGESTGNGWGIYDGECTACAEGSADGDDEASLHYLDVPHGQHRP